MAAIDGEPVTAAFGSVSTSTSVCLFQPQLGVLDRPGTSHLAAKIGRPITINTPTYGTPVPGYVAPDETIEPVRRFSGVLVGILADAKAADRLNTDGPKLSRNVIRSMGPVRSALPRPPAGPGVS